MQDRSIEAIGPDASLLIVDEDKTFGGALVDALAVRGFDGRVVATFDEGLKIVRRAPPAYAVVDLLIPGGTGLELLEGLRHERPLSKLIFLSGYGELSHVVAAIKAGAMDYLTKPSDPEIIASALRAVRGEMPPPPDIAPEPNAVVWDHIFRTYNKCNENVTDTAIRLKMHRRTLQRILKRQNIPRPTRPIATDNVSELHN